MLHKRFSTWRKYGNIFNIPLLHLIALKRIDDILDEPTEYGQKGYC
ncbi:MAG: hypothetical protein ACL7BU_03440 [Candidatus Phlomobacter fragariae]